MLQKYIPNTILSCINYCVRCDFYLMRPDAARYGYTSNIDVSKWKDGMKIYCWTMAADHLFTIIESSTLKDMIIITGDDDHLTNPNGTTLYDDRLNMRYAVPKFMPKNFKKWYSQNAELANNTMIPIPVGVPPPWARGVNDASSLADIIVDIPRTKLMYANFHFETNRFQRPQILYIVGTNLGKECTVANYSEEKSQLKSGYFRDIQEHHYVLCPPGNSKESHRMWESLYLGAIPVVEDNASNRYFAQFFPILVVERWGDITEELLKSKLDYFQSKDWRYDLLDTDNLFKEYGLQ